MKIAVTYDNGSIFQHFGKTQCFKVYTVENSTVVFTELLDSNGSGHGALARVLAENAVDVLICGGIGGGAQSALGDAGISVRVIDQGSGEMNIVVGVEERDYEPAVRAIHREFFE